MAGPGRGDDVVIRERTTADDVSIRRLNDDAFHGVLESTLVDELRATGFAAIELVAVEDTEIVGHILFSALAMTMEAEAVPALALAPMAVRGDRRRRGIGNRLVRTGLDLARRREWWAVIVLGHPCYYPRFGFSCEKARRLRAPFSGAAFMALELVPGALGGDTGQVTYPPAFRIHR